MHDYVKTASCTDCNIIGHFIVWGWINTKDYSEGHKIIRECPECHKQWYQKVCNEVFTKGELTNEYTNWNTNI